MTCCDKCKNDRTATKDSYVCNICGETTYGFVNEFIPQIRMHMKSKHSRRRWIDKYLRYVVESQHIRVIVNDFMEIVSEMNRKNLIKGSISIWLLRY